MRFIRFPALFSFLFPLSCLATNTDDLNKYILGLSYNSAYLLQRSLPGNSISYPVKTKGEKGVTICTNKHTDLSGKQNSLDLFDASNGVVFPGALIKANTDLVDGHPESISLDRSPVTLSIDLPGLGNAGILKVADPTNSDVQAAIQNVLDVWLNTAAAKGYTNSARSSLVVKNAYDSDQLAIELGLGAGWGTDNSLSSKMKVSLDGQTRSTVAVFRQVFYTVTMDTPKTPASVFAPSVTPNDLITYEINAHNPPAYVRSVDYGRTLFVRMDTSSYSNTSDLSGALSFALGVGKIDVTHQEEYKRITQNSTFTVVVLGGGNDAISEFKGDISGLYTYIKSGLAFTKGNPAQPIAYTTQFLRDGSLAQMNLTTSYNQLDCVYHNHGWIQVANTGAFVAKWAMTWDTYETDPENKTLKTVSHDYKSSRLYVNQTDKQYLDGDAHNIHFLAWPVGASYAFDQILDGPPNQCFVMKGIITNPHGYIEPYAGGCWGPG